MQGNGRMLLRVALLMGVAYLLLCWGILGQSANEAVSDYETQFVQAATLALMPHLGFVFLADVFTALALFMYKKAFALTAGILFAVSITFLPSFFWGIIIQMILCFIAYAKMDKPTE